MEQVKDLIGFSLRDSWREVKQEEDWWGVLKQETLWVVKRLLEGAMEGKLVEQLGAGRYRTYHFPDTKGGRYESSAFSW